LKVPNQMLLELSYQFEQEYIPNFLWLFQPKYHQI
jgi:hypothetical protein